MQEATAAHLNLPLSAMSACTVGNVEAPPKANITAPNAPKKPVRNYLDHILDGKDSSGCRLRVQIRVRERSPETVGSGKVGVKDVPLVCPLQSLTLTFPCKASSLIW